MRRDDEVDRAEDLRLALTAYRDALAATTTTDERWLTFAIDVADTLLSLPGRSDHQLEELISLQTEILARRRETSDPTWPVSANLLGDAYSQRAIRRDDEAERDQDLRLALTACRDALAATTPTDDRWLTFAIDVANTLLSLPERSDHQLEELISLQTEILARQRTIHDDQLPVVANLLGTAYRERAMGRDDEVDRAEDLRLALTAYRDALAATTTTDDRWLTFAIDVANTLLSLEDRAEDELEELIILQTEILARRRETSDPTWPVSANLLGTAYRQRAMRRDDEVERDRDLCLALTPYRDALAATTPTDDRWPTFAIGVANTLLSLRDRSDQELAELISLQTEILARRRETSDPTWPVSAKVLGTAYRERAMRRDDEVERDQDLRLALTAYCDALAATTPTDDRWLTFAIDVANTLLSLEDRAEDELEELIILQTEILARRRETRDPTWPVSANLLGDAYRERAARRVNQTDRGQDLGLALAAYRDALAATTPTDDRWLTFAIDVANTLIIHAAVTRAGGPGTLDEATRLVNEAMTGIRDDPLVIGRLLPVLRAALQRQS